jgi:hypothetical protein
MKWSKKMKVVKDAAQEVATKPVEGIVLPSPIVTGEGVSPVMGETKVVNGYESYLLNAGMDPAVAVKYDKAKTSYVKACVKEWDQTETPDLTIPLLGSESVTLRAPSKGQPALLITTGGWATGIKLPKALK